MEADPILERSRERRRRMEVNKAGSFAEAEEWDIEYWQSRTPEERLEAYLSLREDVEKAIAARGRP